MQVKTDKRRNTGDYGYSLPDMPLEQALMKVKDGDGRDLRIFQSFYNIILERLEKHFCREIK